MPTKEPTDQELELVLAVFAASYQTLSYLEDVLRQVPFGLVLAQRALAILLERRCIIPWGPTYPSSPRLYKLTDVGSAELQRLREAAAAQG